MRGNKLFIFVLVLFFYCGLFVSMFESVALENTLVANSWISRAPMSQARGGLGVVAVDGKIYAIGGSTADNTNYFNNVYLEGFVGTNECYDPATDTWVSLADMPTPRSNFAIAAYQDKIYCIGGVIGTTLDDQYGLFTQRVSCNITEVYDIAINSWSTKASVHYSFSDLSACVVDGKIFVLRASVFVCYDPVLDMWSNRTFLPVSPYNEGFAPVLVVVDNKIVVTSDIVFGISNSDVRGVFVYDPVRDMWCEGETRERIVHLGGAGATTGVYAPKKVYVLGEKPVYAGELEMELAQGVSRVYDVSSDSWSDGAGMLTPRLGFGVAVVDDILYVVGGRTDHRAASAVNEAYIPIGHNLVSVPIPSVTTPVPSVTPLVPTEFFLKYTVAVVALVLIAGVVAIVSVLYFKKKQNNGEKIKSIKYDKCNN